VVNFNLFTANSELKDGTLWIVEQIPGLVMGADRTEDLRRGYWPSYNIPYFKEIYELSGYSEMFQKHGNGFSYQLAPRAQIFRRDSDKVIDLSTLQDLMRYNDYLEDPYSENNPMRAICSRGDLQQNNPIPSGCYDTKVTQASMVHNRESLAINGPTTSHTLPPFNWTKFDGYLHKGQPNLFSFDFVHMRPKFNILETKATS
jgi:hypothetical protein